MIEDKEKLKDSWEETRKKERNYIQELDKKERKGKSKIKKEMIGTKIVMENV